MKMKVRSRWGRVDVAGTNDTERAVQPERKERRKEGKGDQGQLKTAIGMESSRWMEERRVMR